MTYTLVVLFLSFQPLPPVILGNSALGPPVNLYSPSRCLTPSLGFSYFQVLITPAFDFPAWISPLNSRPPWSCLLFLSVLLSPQGLSCCSLKIPVHAYLRTFALPVPSAYFPQTFTRLASSFPALTQEPPQLRPSWLPYIEHTVILTFLFSSLAFLFSTFDYLIFYITHLFCS